MLDATTVVENVRSRPREKLRVFWVRVPRDRDGFRREIAQLRARSPIVPWVLRKTALRHADSVMSDILDILNDAREDILAVENAATEAGGVDLVMLGKADLELAADTSSPILLPDWFPVAPGQTPEVHIEDLTWSARVPLSDPKLALDDLRRLLHELDETLTRSLLASRAADHRLTNSLWDQIGPKSSGIEDTLRGAQRRLDAVIPTAYRPSTRHGKPTVVGLLWGHANGTPPDAVSKTAKALVEALRIKDAEVGRDASLAAVLNRPSSPLAGRVQWALSLIVTVRCACQLVTAAAHADEYPRFGAELLQATSHDLRSFLDDAVARLRIAEGAP